MVTITIQNKVTGEQGIAEEIQLSVYRVTVGDTQEYISASELKAVYNILEVTRYSNSYVSAAGVKTEGNKLTFEFEVDSKWTLYLEEEAGCTVAIYVQSFNHEKYYTSLYNTVEDVLANGIGLADVEVAVIASRIAELKAEMV